jgi:hypothetical protein
MMDNGQERFTSEKIRPSIYFFSTDSSEGQVAIDEATKLFQQAVQKCPQAKITFGGYR